MNCFTIQSNDKIESFIKAFYEELKHHYPTTYENYWKSKLLSVSGWSTPKFDLINVTFEEGYDFYHPSNWNKEILHQQGEINVDGRKLEFTYGGHRNIIDHFSMPPNFYKSFEFKEISVKNELEQIYVRNTRGVKRFKSLLKKDYRDYLNNLNKDEIFVRMIDKKSYIAIKELESNRYLAFNTKYQTVIINYKKPDIWKKPNSGYIELTDNSYVTELNININEVLKKNLSKSEIYNLEQNTPA